MEQLVSTLSSWLAKFPPNRIIVMIGNSGSGKTTLVNKLTWKLDLRIVSPDAIRILLTGSELDQTQNAQVWDIAKKQMVKHLECGNHLIVDATNAKAADRRALVKYLREIVPTHQVVGIWMDIPYEQCEANNAQRLHPRPEHALKRMHKQLGGILKQDDDKVLYPSPALADGFDGLWRVDARDWQLK